MKNEKTIPEFNYHLLDDTLNVSRETTAKALREARKNKIHIEVKRFRNFVIYYLQGFPFNVNSSAFTIDRQPIGKRIN